MFKKSISVLLSLLIIMLTTFMGFAAETNEMPDMSEFHDFAKFTVERENTSHNFERNSATTPNAVSTPKLSNGSYDFYELTSNWSSSDGKISWDDRSQTLTLNNAYIVSGYSSSDNFGIYVPHNSTIVLVGYNTVISGNSGSGGYDSMGIICNGNLNFEGSGSLYVKGGDASRNSYGIIARYDVNFKNCNIEAVAGYGTQFSGGFSSESGNITFTDTTFIGKGGKSNSGCSVGVDSVAECTIKNSKVAGYANSSALNWGLYFGNVVAQSSEVIGYGAEVPSTCGSADIYCSYGIYIDGNASAYSTDFEACGGSVKKSGNGSASYGLACQGDFGATACPITAYGRDSVNTSFGTFVGGKCILDYCNVYSVTESCKKAIGFSATNITINCGVYHIGCADAATSASAVHAVNELCINGGEVLADCQSANNVFAISAGKINVNSGTIVARASESTGSSCGIYGDVSVYCGDVTATGEDSAFNGNLTYVSDKCKISASDKYFSDDLTDGSLSSGAIRVPSANNAIAKTARVYYDMNGKMICAYALADNLSYRGTTRLLAHCENPRVMYKYESSNNSVIKVEDNIFGFVKAVNSGTATIKVTATDLLTGEPIRDADGNIASATVEIKCTMTFWEKIIRFFRSIFGLD